MKILLLLLLLLTGCQKQTKYNSKITKEINLEYGNPINLYTIIKDENITSPDIQIKINELKTQIIKY
mgnify:FL=1